MKETDRNMFRDRSLSSRIPKRKPSPMKMKQLRKVEALR